MDLLEIMPWGREEVEQERKFLSEAWLSAPILEENDDLSIKMGNELGKSADPPQEHKTTEQEEMKSVGSNETENRHSIGRHLANSKFLKDQGILFSPPYLPTGFEEIINFESFLKWMDMNVMELAMYQQSSVRQDMIKHYTEGCDWENSNSSIADTTQALLQEFETVYEVYHDTLTPPHSRTPSPPPPLITIQQAYVQQQQASVTQPVQDPSTVNYPVDLAQELAMLDELIRDRAAGLEDTNPPAPPKDYTAPEPTNLFGVLVNASPAVPVQINVPDSIVSDQVLEELIVPDADIPSVKVEVVSPAQSPVSLQEVPSSSERFPSSVCYHSPTSVAPSSPGSPRPNTPASSTYEEGEEPSDPEWVPTKMVSTMKSAPKRQRAKPYMRSSKSVSSGYSSSERSEISLESSNIRGRRAQRIRGQVAFEDRKERKKEQNKNAATRYRQKKKAEAEEVASEEKEIENKNDQLRAKAADLAKEVSYLKKLMREMFKARGML